LNRPHLPHEQPISTVNSLISSNSQFMKKATIQHTINPFSASTRGPRSRRGRDCCLLLSAVPYKALISAHLARMLMYDYGPQAPGAECAINWANCSDGDCVSQTRWPPLTQYGENKNTDGNTLIPLCILAKIICRFFDGIISQIWNP
jgi:hypothetical protein